MQIPRVGVGVFVWRDGKFLMGQRRNAHGDGTWTIPGGHLEFNESWEQCAEREIMEETGMRIANLRLFAVTNDLFQEEAKHYVTIWMRSDWVANEPVVTEPDKYINLEWRTFDDLPVPLFLPWQQLKLARPELFSAGSAEAPDESLLV